MCLCLALAGTGIIPNVYAADIVVDTMAKHEIHMVRGELEVLKVFSLTRISIADPNIADITEANEREVTVIAKDIGQTPVFIWDKHGKRTLMIYVVNQELSMLKTRLEELFKSAEISEITIGFNDKEGKLVLTGKIPKHKQEVFDQIVDPFAEGIMNLAREEEIKDLIEVDVLVTELSSSHIHDLGIDWTTSNSSSGLAFNYSETIPAQDGSLDSLFKIGDFARGGAINATINAIISDGKGKVVSKPKLVVVSGETASFNVGGEVGIRTTTTTDSVTQESIEFKEYGVGMTITPTLVKDKVELQLNINISEVDPNTPQGSNEVAFITSTADTLLYLNDRQTIVMAGLMKKSESESIARVPVLSKIPIFGLLFTNKSNPVGNSETELVISLTPIILRQSTFEENIKKQESMVQKRAEQASITMETIKKEPKIETTVAVEKKEEPKIETIKDVVKVEKIEEQTAVVPKAKRTKKVIKKVKKPEEKKEAIIQKSSSSEEVKDLKSMDKVLMGNYQYPTYTSKIPKEMQAYVRAIQRKVSDSVEYPRLAEDYNWEGTVKLGLLILKDGTLAYAMVKESSGYEIIDENAVETARTIAPYEEFPQDADLQELNVTIPIVYSLKK